MRRRSLLRLAALAPLLEIAGCTGRAAPHAPDEGGPGARALPEPATETGVSLDEVLARRRSVRAYAADPLTSAQVAQLFWAAQGITHERGLRTAPSAGALYPLESYVVTPDGMYHYEPRDHVLTRRTSSDLRPTLFEVALQQEPIRDAPAIFVIAAIYDRTASKYGQQRSPRYVHMEAGHAAQNLLLQSVALGLAAVPIGAFDDEGVQKALGLPADQAPLYLIPVGRPLG